MLVTIIMTVYNSEIFLEKAIKSILNQTYKKFEFLIIDDGSTDKSLEIIKKFKDKRIIILKNAQNMGLIYSLNRGIKESKGKYIVRMDSDDICIHNRIEKQIEYLEKNQDIAVLGSNAEMFVSKYPFIKKRTELPRDSETIKCRLLFESCFIHPSIVIRKEILDTYNLEYEKENYGVEDYGLWNEFSKLNKFKMENMKENLIKYRIVSSGITQVANKNLTQRIIRMNKIYSEVLEKLNFNKSQKQLQIHSEISLVNILKEFQYSLKEKEEWLEILKRENEILKIYNFEKFSQELAYQYFKNCVVLGEYSDYNKSIFYCITNESKFKFYFNKLKFKFRKKLKI